MAFYDIIAILFLGLLLVPIGLFVITLINLTLEEVRSQNSPKSTPMATQQEAKPTAARTGLRLVK